MAVRPVVDLVVRCGCFGVKVQDLRMTVIGHFQPVTTGRKRPVTALGAGKLTAIIGPSGVLVFGQMRMLGHPDDDFE